jgi:Glyoxalase superfamily protein
VLYVEDAGWTVAWHERLGFRKEWEHRFEPGFPWFVSVARGQARLYLSEHKGDARPDTLIHLYVNDVTRSLPSSIRRRQPTLSPGPTATPRKRTADAGSIPAASTFPARPVRTIGVPCAPRHETRMGDHARQIARCASIGKHSEFCSMHESRPRSTSLTSFS